MNLGLALLAAILLPGDARRGAEVFNAQKCSHCHSMEGRYAARAYTPSVRASLIWNHAPQMWPAMENAGIPKPQLSEQDASDLFAYFYAARYMDQLGDAGRGLRAFRDNRCAECHSTSAEGAPGRDGAPAVVRWESLADSIALAAAMWNHAPRMRDAMAKRRVPWPQVSSQMLTDMLVYLRNAPGVRLSGHRFSLGTAEMGGTLFRSKGYAGCHVGKLDLSSRVRGRTTTDFVAAMWNHADKMEPMPLTPQEMRAVASYLWSTQYFEPAGNPRRGSRFWTAKGCAGCHDDTASGAPKLAGSGMNSISIIAALWRHGPAMLERMKEKRMRWPQFKEGELADLLAYVQERK